MDTMIGMLVILFCVWLAWRVPQRIPRNREWRSPKRHDHVYKATYDQVWNVRFYECECGIRRSAEEIEGPNGPPNPGLDRIPEAQNKISTKSSR